MSVYDWEDVGGDMADDEAMLKEASEICEGNYFKHISGKNDAEFINLLLQHIERQDEIIHKAISKLKMGCTGCVYYDQQQISLICHDCKRYYKDMYEEW